MKKQRLSSIDRLPREADAIREWAIATYLKKRASQLEIYARMNAELSKRGLPPVSKSGLNRWLIAGRENGFAQQYHGAQQHFGKPNCCPLCGSEVKPAPTKREWVERMHSLLRGARKP